MPLLLVSPSLAWLALDRSVWPWDQAWYGAHTVGLYETLRDHVTAWPAALLRTTPWKPPAVAWIGHLFVPLGAALGSVDAALRLSTWACHLGALMLVFASLRRLWDRTAPAAAAVTLVAAAPVFVFLSTQYLAEASQTLAVAWFGLVMCRAPRWSRSMIAAQVLGAAAFAMLAKTTSPLYCALPGAVALFAGFRARIHQPEAPSSGSAWPWWVLAALLAGGAVAWYAVNFRATLYHAMLASFGPVAEHYGRRATLIAGIRDWASTIDEVFFMRPVATAIAAIVLFGAVAAVRRLRRDGGRHADLCAATALLQVLLAVGLFALSPNRDSRYAAPLLPLVAIVAAWALSGAGTDRAAWAAAALLGVQLVAVHTQALGLWPRRPPILRTQGLDPVLAIVDRDTGPADELAAIVERTCGRKGFGRQNFVGVDLLHLSGHSLTYATAKERLAGRAGACRYDSLGFQSVADGQRMTEAYEYVYWVTVDPEVRPVPPLWDFANRSAPMLFRQLRRRGVLQPEPWDGPPGILVFRFVNR